MCVSVLGAACRPFSEQALYRRSWVSFRILDRDHAEVIEFHLAREGAEREPAEITTRGRALAASRGYPAVPGIALRPSRLDHE